MLESQKNSSELFIRHLVRDMVFLELRFALYRDENKALLEIKRLIRENPELKILIREIIHSDEFSKLCYQALKMNMVFRTREKSKFFDTFARRVNLSRKLINYTIQGVKFGKSIKIAKVLHPYISLARPALRTGKILGKYFLWAYVSAVALKLAVFVYNTEIKLRKNYDLESMRRYFYRELNL